MKITTPLMYSRRFISAAYQNNLYCGVISNKGSGITLQDDFLANVWTPTSITRNADDTIVVDDSATIPLTTGAFPVIAVDTDIIVVGIGQPVASSTSLICGLGSANPTTSTGGVVGRYTNTSGSFFGDSTNKTDFALDTPVTVPSDVNIALVGALDRSDTATGAMTYLYDLDNDAVLDDEPFATNTAAAITPDSSMRLSDWQKLYGFLVFTFPSGTLPTTWKADMVAMANSLIALKS
jgi:hypothetical protein